MHVTRPRVYPRVGHWTSRKSSVQSPTSPKSPSKSAPSNSCTQLSSNLLLSSPANKSPTSPARKRAQTATTSRMCHLSALAALAAQVDLPSVRAPLRHLRCPAPAAAALANATALLDLAIVSSWTVAVLAADTLMVRNVLPSRKMIDTTRLALHGDMVSSFVSRCLLVSILQAF